MGLYPALFYFLYSRFQNLFCQGHKGFFPYLGSQLFQIFFFLVGGILPLAAQISVRRTPHSESEADKNQGASVCADDGTAANRYTAENNTFEFILQ